jgi:hypothetical protein
MWVGTRHECLRAFAAKARVWAAGSQHAAHAVEIAQITALIGALLAVAAYLGNRQSGANLTRKTSSCGLVFALKRQLAR